MVRIVGLNFVMNLALIPFFAQGGLALSTSITSLLNTVYLTYKLREKMPLMPFRILINSLKKQALLFLGLIVFLLLISSFLRPLADAAGAKIARLLDPSNAPRYAAGVIVLIGGAGGALLYLGAGFALRLSELDVFRGLLKKKK